MQAIHVLAKGFSYPPDGYLELIWSEKSLWLAKPLLRPTRYLLVHRLSMPYNPEDRGRIMILRGYGEWMLKQHILESYETDHELFVKAALTPRYWQALHPILIKEALHGPTPFANPQG